MKATTTKLQPGSYSTGTLRAEDLFPVLERAMRSVDPAQADKAQDEWNTTPSDWEQDEWRNEIVADLMDALGEFCPEGHYFGGHEGDGADFGVWPA